MQHEFAFNNKIMGGCPSPFDAWLTNIGLKTFELRMKRHCENALKIAQFLEKHPKVSRVFYPGLESHPDYALACRQMHSFGGMISFELKGGMEGWHLVDGTRADLLSGGEPGHRGQPDLPPRQHDTLHRFPRRTGKDGFDRWFGAILRGY